MKMYILSIIMSRKFRTFLFGFFVLLFAVAAPALALYAQGYRINWPLEAGKKLVVMTGGFFVKATPKQVSVYVNERLKKQTDFFFDSALADNLLPRKYKFEIKKPGYQTWEKNLEIKEKEVTEARNILLFPDRINFTNIGKDIREILPSPDGQKIALRENGENGWSLKLYDISQNITLKLANQNNFAGKNPEFSDWDWIDAKTLEVKSNSAAASSTYDIAIDKNPPRLTKKTNSNATSTAMSANAKADDKYYLGDDGFVYKNDNAAAPAKAGPAQITPAPDTDRQLWVFGNYIFAREGSRLYVSNSSLETFSKISDNLSGEPKLSPDGKKVAYASDSEIWVFYLESKTDQPQAAASDKIFIARLSEKIADCDWFNSDYLIFVAGDSVKTAEIDNRDKINFADLAKVSAISGQEQNKPAEMFVRQDKKIIYLFANNALYKSDPIE
ncbi:MAG: hypothetical protein L7H18_03565 [Candidatus Nealsonbacteria bacterium DGGOD1a]|nr:MAG: hypothetical protein L7H18_03565 [Candidatus Nealsonbacteria bacterium DGGOD1a]